MVKTKLLAIVIAAFGVPMAGIAAHAQDNGGLLAPEMLAKPTPGQLLNQDLSTGIGATVPRPGVPQASGPTPLDRSIQQQDNRIDNSICTGC